MSHLYRSSLFLQIIFLVNFCFATELVAFGELPYSPHTKQDLIDGEVFAISEVRSNDKTQSLNFSIAGLHQKDCNIALKTLARYEKYSDYLSVVKKSQYDEQNKHVFMYISSFIPPISMTLNVQIDRIEKPGIYPFTFTTGFLKGLLAYIHISEYQSRCLFYIDANWKGPDTGYPDYFFAFFTKALSKISMEKLFAISKN